MRKTLSVVGLTIATGVASLAFSTPSASASTIGPCNVKDAPGYTYDGRTLTVDLRTELVCWDQTVAVVG